MKEVKNSLPTFIHWFSWTISLGASVFLSVFLIKEGIPAIMNGSGKELIPQMPGLILAIAGCLVSFFRIRPGAIAMMAGGLTIVVVIAIQESMAAFGMMVVYGVSYIVPGMFFLLVRKHGNEKGN